MNDIAIYTPKARINQGRWVVDCASPICTSAMTLGPPAMDIEERVWPGLSIGQDVMTCRDCGYTTQGVEWPPDPRGIELILSWRPDPVTRNWEPHETLTDLVAENLEHGVGVPGLDPELSGDTTLLREADGVAVGGLIGDLLTQLAGAANRPQIGA